MNTAEKNIFWDYHIAKNWRPDTRKEWIWYLERKINYGAWKGLRTADIQRFLPFLKLDPAKKLFLKAYFKYYEKKKKV